MTSQDTIDLRCACGRIYHADSAHAGRSIRCRCGRTLPIPTDRSQCSRRPPQAGRASKRAPRKPASFAARWRRIWNATGLITRHHRTAARRRWTTQLGWGYCALVAAFTIFLWSLGDRWWPATALLFGPRWLILLPLPVLAVAAILFRPAVLLLLGVSLPVALGPGMGYRLGWHRWSGTGSADLRIVTFNIQGAENFRAPGIPLDLERYAPDVLIFQECDATFIDPQYWPEGWFVRFDDGFCLGSKYPVAHTVPVQEVKTGEFGGTGIARLYQLQSPRGPIDLIGVHLETPRKGLEVLRYGAEVARMDPSTLVRDIGSGRISRWIARQSRTAIVAGDFNMPVESVIYRRYWSDCENAFSRVGSGFGYTRVLKHFSVRIDHLLTCGGWVPVKAFVGPDLGSDHLPLIVDLHRSRPPLPQPARAGDR